MTTPSYRKLADHWKSMGLRLTRGNSDEMVHHFESQNGVVLPCDLREYFLNLDGMEQTGGHDCDANGFSFWPLMQLKSIVGIRAEQSMKLATLQDEDKYYVFADYLQWSWAYAIRLDDRPVESNQIIHVGTVVPKTIAPSFADFVDLYLHDDRSLYPDPS